MKTCPFCAEEIQDAAIVCKHCNRDLVAATTQPAVAASRVTVVDFDMPFGSIVVLILKWALAAIPAMFILGVIVAGISVILAAITAGFASASLSPRSTAAPVSAGSSTPALVVTMRPTPTGWRASNDSSVTRGKCSLSIEGHSVEISQFPRNASVELAASAFSDGGLPAGAAVTKAGVSMSCLLPERSAASIYLFQ